jgi:hypothetical protein
MAKKHLLELQETLYNSLAKELRDLEIEINESAKVGMIDPEDVETAVSMLRSIDLEIQNLGSGLKMASDYPNDFAVGYNSINNMVKGIYSTIDLVLKQEPDNPIVKEYQKSLERNLPILTLYKNIKEVKDIPKSKKNQKKWANRGWYLPDKPFWPFKAIWENLEVLRSFIDENL